MNKTKPAPAGMPCVHEAERHVALRSAELESIRAEIAAKEGDLPRLAESDDNEAFEAASLVIERLYRAATRAGARLETAREALTEAVASAEQGRRRSLFAEGQEAATEAERLASEYAKHAEQIASVFRKIDKLGGPIRVANKNLPSGEHEIDADHALGIHDGVELPAATRAGERFWWRAGQWNRGPLDPPPEKYEPAVVRSDLVPQSEKSTDPQTLENGSRKITLPPNQWPPRPDSN